MSWNKLAPIVKTTGRPMASASIVVNKDGVPKISLILSASLKEEFGDPERCDISAGAGEHEGSLLVEFGPQGGFELKNFVHGGARVFAPVPDWCPDKPAINQPCTLGEKHPPPPGSVFDPENLPSVVVNLPVEAWRASIADRIRAPAAPPPQPPPGAKRLDMVEYLSGKGFTVSRLGNERFLLSGENVTQGAVLKAVNDSRELAGLTPLARSQVW